MYDVVIIGGGPAGLSAAIQVRQRDKQALVLWNPAQRGWLQKAEHITNYPGLPDASGAGLLDTLHAHAQAMGAVFQEGLARQIMPTGDAFAVAIGDDFVECRRVILATGAKQPQLLPGEEQLLGRGVSYCATCDGMFYRGKRIAVLGQSAHAPAETNYLASLAAEVLYYGKVGDGLAGNVRVMTGKIERILGDTQCTGVYANGEEVALDGLFILRDAMALDTLLPGLAHDGPFIRVDRQMCTSIPGVFAAGDCTGQPLQVAKAVGEGCVAGLAACE